MKQEKPLFTSRIATILTMVGVAVGLGNVWRFPYMMGSYGGSAFLAVYLLFTLLFAIPALMAEISLGKLSGNGTLDAFQRTLGKQWGSLIGYFLIGVITVSGSYYAVVVGNVFFTASFSIFTGFTDSSIQGFIAELGNGNVQYFVTAILVLLSMFVVFKGLNKGIEWVSTRIMPFFVIALVYIIIHSLSLPGAINKLYEFLQPDFSALTTTEVFAALGQAFFSIGLGGTFVVVYSGYLKEKESIPHVALYTGLGDLGSSLLISLFIIPSILTFGLPLDSGPSLIFQTFPKLFQSMPGGRFVGSLFLVSISLVALLSLIAAYEVVIRSLSFNKSKKSRNKIILIASIVQLILIFPSTMKPGIIGVLDLIFGSGMQVFGSLMAILAISWYLSRSSFIEGIFNTKHETWFQKFTIIWIKWVIPVVLGSVLIGYIYSIV